MENSGQMNSQQSVVQGNAGATATAQPVQAVQSPVAQQTMPPMQIIQASQAAQSVQPIQTAQQIQPDQSVQAVDDPLQTVEASADDSANKTMITALDRAAQDAAKTATAATVEKTVRIETLLEECIKRKASDLHVQVGLPPVLRIDGSLVPIAGLSVLTEEMVQKIVFSTLDSEQRETLSKDKEFDYSFEFGKIARFRVNAFQERGNLAAAFRLIPNKMPTLNDLGLPQVLSTFTNYPRGLVLVTGPTGSGKSTTLAALIDKINQEKSEHIITIEDPIEFVHQSKKSVVVQREVHYDTFSFQRALKSILRQDPDVVLLGEMRDLETMQSAITIAETGHLVFATLHTNSAAQSIDRMIDVFPPEQQPQIRTQLASILMAVCSQRLIPAVGGGRIAACEILVANTAVRSIIREGKTYQLDTAIQTGVNEGMQTMDRTLAKLVHQGIITYDNALEYAVDTTEFKRLARG